MKTFKNMAEEKQSTNKVRKSISLAEKIHIIKHIQSGKSATSVARLLGYNRSTIRTIVKNKQNIMDLAKQSPVHMKAKRLSYKRDTILLKMECRLVEWLEEQNRLRIPVNTIALREKATSIFQDLSGDSPSSNSRNIKFVASPGWLQRFRVRVNLKNLEPDGVQPASKISVNNVGEVGSYDSAEVQDFIEKLGLLINSKEFTPDQIFNVDETLLWKTLPDVTNVKNEECTSPRQVTEEDRFTVLLGANASGRCKLKPMLIHRTLNPTALKGISKSSLPIIWKSNKRLQVTKSLFEEWFFHHFVPEVKQFCTERTIPFKIMLVIDNAPGHPIVLDDVHPNVKVVFLPPDISHLLQPMQLGIIQTFKAFYLCRILKQAVESTCSGNKILTEFWNEYDVYSAIKNIADSWHDVESSSIRNSWRNLCPRFYSEPSILLEECITSSIITAIECGNRLQIDLTADKCSQFIANLEDELLAEHIAESDDSESYSSNSGFESTAARRFCITELKEALNLIEKGLAKLERQDPNSLRFVEANRGVQNAVSCYRHIYNEKLHDYLFNSSNYEDVSVQQTIEDSSSI